MASTRGLRPLHHGFWLGNIIFPPSQFAMAWVGNHSPKALESIVDCTVASLERGKLSAADIPFLAEYNANIRSSSGRPFNLDDLRTLAHDRFGTAKLIDRIAVQEINKSHHLGSVSLKELVSGIVTSREKGQITRPYEVSLHSPFITSSSDIYGFWVEGGTLHSRKAVAKGCHWSLGRAHEKGFLKELKQDIHKKYLDKRTHLMDKDVAEDYTTPISVIDYARASMLDMLYRLKLQGSYKVKGQDPKKEVIMPFDFHSAPHLGLEGVLQILHHPGRSSLAMRDTPRRLLHQVDEHFIGKSGFVTPLFSRLFKEGRIIRGTLPADKKTPDYSWAVLQAFEMHCYQNNRQFKKYSLEFPKTPYQTVSIVFEEPGADRSVRILYSEHFERPYYLVKYFKEPGTPKRRSLKGDPKRMINFSEDIHRKRQYYKKEWQEEDYRTGREVICRLHEPNKRILNLAYQLSRKEGFTGILPMTLMDDYKRIYHENTVISQSRS